MKSRDQGSGISDQYAGLEVEMFHLCPACNVETWGPRYCPDCRRFGEELELRAMHFAARASDRSGALAGWVIASVAMATAIGGFWGLIWGFRQALAWGVHLWRGGN